MMYKTKWTLITQENEPSNGEHVLISFEIVIIFQM
jgi:hypothetical protein